MILEFDPSFSKDISGILDKRLKKRIVAFIEEAELADNIEDIRNVKKLTGFKSYYRVRIGDYRIDLELISTGTVRFMLWPIGKTSTTSFLEETRIHLVLISHRPAQRK